MNATETQRRYDAACAIGREAAELARKMFEGREANTFEMKGHQDYLTEADGAVERLITGRINELFPGDSVLGEEGGGSVGENTWVLDPIDGTANFARGIPHFCISIGFVSGGIRTAGVIANPLANEFYAARRGHGATLNGKPMKISGITDIRQSTVELGWSSRLPIADYLKMVERVTATGAGFRRGGSGALGLAYVAAGRTEGYAELHINSWDVAAGLLLVEEAGGWANDFFAGDGMTKGNPVLACVPGLRAVLSQTTGIA